jgi:hypothetical protein
MILLKDHQYHHVEEVAMDVDVQVVVIKGVDVDVGVEEVLHKVMEEQEEQLNQQMQGQHKEEVVYTDPILIEQKSIPC